MRPVGGVAVAMRAAALSGPATVRELADRAHVGYDLARCTATRLVQRGDLMVVGAQRPMVLAVPPAGDALADALHVLHCSFWEQPPGGDWPAEWPAEEVGFEDL